MLSPLQFSQDRYDVIVSHVLSNCDHFDRLLVSLASMRSRVECDYHSHEVYSADRCILKELYELLYGSNGLSDILRRRGKVDVFEAAQMMCRVEVSSI